MFHKLDLRDRLIVVAAVPLAVVAIVVVGLIFVNTSGARAFALFAGAGLFAAAAVSLSVGRSIMATVDGVADHAEALVDARRGRPGSPEVDDLPAGSAPGTATESASGPLAGPAIESVTGSAVGSATESESGVIARLVGAIGDLDAAVDEVDRARQDEVRDGLRNIVTNLARRSQTLLDRQVEYLDELESGEENPERLDQLFKVDHLATRMRRNAESLIVLAEADPGRRRGGPVDVADVLRVAMGEVEIYQQIELTSVDQGRLSAASAVDLAHLTAELMENATQFSPPSTPVLVAGRFDGRGSFLITIADQGMGMTDDRLEATNQVLAEPPELGLGMGRSLGFMVVGRLAQRLGASVAMTQNEANSGLTATIKVPSDLFLSANAGPAPAPVHRPKPDGDTAEMAQPLAPPAAVRSLDMEATDDVNGGADPDQAVTPFDWGVEPLVDGDPTGRDANSETDSEDANPTDSDAITETDGDAETESVAEPVVGPAPDVPLSRSIEVGADPSSADDTSEIENIDEWTPPSVTPDAPARLDEAVPSGDAFEHGVASLLDESAPAGRPPQRLDGAGSTPAGLTKRQRTAGESQTGSDRPVASTKRDPNEVRSRLMRYREGLSGRKPNGTDETSRTRTSKKRSADESSGQDSSSNEGR